MRERLVSIADLASEPGRPGRWIYTRQGIAKLSRTRDFPAPVSIVSRGRIKVWRLAHILDFERRHPEVVSYEQRRRKRLGMKVQVPIAAWKLDPPEPPAPVDMTDRPWPWTLLG